MDAKVETKTIRPRLNRRKKKLVPPTSDSVIEMEREE